MARGDQRIIENTATELAQYEELSSADRTLHILEYERCKYRFFMDMSKDILFEYTCDPPMLALSPWGARRLGLEESIVDPHIGDRLQDQIGPQELRDLLRHTTPEEPIVEYRCQARLDGQNRPVRITSRAMWSSDEPPQYTGAIGKVAECEEEEGAS